MAIRTIAALKAKINQDIVTNTTRAITATVLNGDLIDIVDSLNNEISTVSVQANAEKGIYGGSGTIGEITNANIASLTDTLEFSNGTEDGETTILHLERGAVGVLTNNITAGKALDVNGKTNLRDDVAVLTGKKITFGATTEYIDDNEEGNLTLNGTSIYSKISGIECALYNTQFGIATDISVLNDGFTFTPSTYLMTTRKSAGIVNTIDFATLTTVSRTWSMPDATGTVALNTTGEWTNATNLTPTRGGFDADATTVAELADNLGTLISDLKDAGILL